MNSASNVDLFGNELSDIATVDAVLDESETEQLPHNRFQITSYGADMTVFELTHRLGKELIIPPAFQRKYVWNKKQASRFVESLLMGLPVPGIFLFKDQSRKKQLLVDGLQRLQTMAYFKKKEFEGKLFDLSDVAEPWLGKTWDTLSPEDRDAIDQSVIHATIFQQDYPKDKDRSIYEVFERINTGGLRLSYQEIRACVSYGGFTTLLREINADKNWREIFGKQSTRLKDEELILRFFALLHDGGNYKKPMREFLDTFLQENREFEKVSSTILSTQFKQTIAVAKESLGERAFRTANSLNAAIFDAVMVAIARRLAQGPIKDMSALAKAYQKLLEHQLFINSFIRATSDDESVKNRLSIATDEISKVP